MPSLDDVNARVRGLAAHLLRPERVPELAAAADLWDLVRRLERAGYPLTLEPGPLTPGALEGAVRRLAASRLRLLARWCGNRAATLAIVFEEEDRRNLRTLIRGAVAGTSSDARLAGTIPTASLPLRALEELAHQTDLRSMGALLALWGNPYAVVLRDLESSEHPDLLRLEVRLGREFARRALQAARQGDRVLQAHVRDTIDLENACAALLLSGGDRDVSPAECFIPGGSWITPAVFEVAATAPDRDEAARRLARALGTRPVARALLRAAGRLSELDDELLAAQLTERRAAARLDPLSSAPLLAYALALRAETRTLGRLVWGVALGIPAPALAAELAGTT
jgi:V/A-type H+-transporting ATPase subunit C